VEWAARVFVTAWAQGLHGASKEPGIGSDGRCMRPEGWVWDRGAGVCVCDLEGGPGVCDRVMEKAVAGVDGREDIEADLA